MIRYKIQKAQVAKEDGNRFSKIKKIIEETKDEREKVASEAKSAREKKEGFGK